MYEAFSYTHFNSNIRPPVACKSREVFIIRWQLSRTVPVWPTSKSTVFKRSFKSDGVTHCMVLVRLGGRRLVSISGNLIQSCSVPPSFYNKLQVLDVINCKRTLQFNGCCRMNSLKGMTRSAGVGTNSFHSTEHFGYIFESQRFWRFSRNVLNCSWQQLKVSSLGLH
jgi:hypothetical protein